MKSITKSILIILCIWLLGSVQLIAQEWSEAQQEVWQTVETGWDLIVKKDLEGYMAHFHDDFSGWFNQNALPTNKASLRKLAAHSFATTTTLIFEIQPVAIKILDNVAIAQYYYSRILKDVEGKEINDSGRFTDILMKQGDKWVAICDHGGSSATN